MSNHNEYTNKIIGPDLFYTGSKIERLPNVNLSSTEYKNNGYGLTYTSLTGTLELKLENNYNILTFDKGVWYDINGNPTTDENNRVFTYDLSEEAIDENLSAGETTDVNFNTSFFVGFGVDNTFKTILQDINIFVFTKLPTETQFKFSGQANLVTFLELDNFNPFTNYHKNAMQDESNFDERVTLNFYEETFVAGARSQFDYPFLQITNETDDDLQVFLYGKIGTLGKWI